MMGAQDQHQCVDQDLAPLDLLGRHSASIMRVSLDPAYVGQGFDCIQNAYKSGYRIYLTLGGYSSEPQEASAWYAHWIDFYERAAPLWAVGIESEPELAHDAVPAETSAQYRAVWNAVAPVIHRIVPDAILVFGEGSPWSENFIKLAWDDTAPQDVGAIGFHCYGSGLRILPEFSAWAADRNIPMWCSEETDWLDPATDLTRVLAVSPNTQVVVYYYWPRPLDPPPYLTPAPLPAVLVATPKPPAPQPTAPKPPAAAMSNPPTPIIVSHPTRRSRTRKATFRFRDARSAVFYQCRRDRQGWSKCSSPKRYTGLKCGKHTFYVRATLPAGASNVARFTWTIRR
jgi:hypothetical protein